MEISLDKKSLNAIDTLARTIEFLGEEVRELKAVMNNFLPQTNQTGSPLAPSTPPLYDGRLCKGE